MSPQRDRMRSVWIGVTGAMALVVGFWVFSLRTRIGQPTPGGETDASLTRAYEQFRKTRDELEQQYASFRTAVTTPTTVATTTASQAVLEEMKKRIEQRPSRP